MVKACFNNRKQIIVYNYCAQYMSHILYCPLFGLRQNKLCSVCTELSLMNKGEQLELYNQGWQLCIEDKVFDWLFLRISCINI